MVRVTGSGVWGGADGGRVRGGDLRAGFERGVGVCGWTDDSEKGLRGRGNRLGERGGVW